MMDLSAGRLWGRMLILRADWLSALFGPYTNIGKRVYNPLQVVNLPHQR